MTNEAARTNKEVESLRRQLAEARDNLLLIHERQSKYVLETDIPLHLEKEERKCKRRIQHLEARIAEAEAPEQPLSPVPGAVDIQPRTIPTDVPTTIPIPAGPFWMGCPLGDPDAHENEQPRREVYLPEYQIGLYPVTNAQYARFLAANPHHPIPYLDVSSARPYNWDPQARTYPEGKAEHPVVLVSWEDAVAYCDWLSGATRKDYRLPTEEEWEKAARGGLPETRRYPWGDEWQPDFCNTRELGRNGTTSVHEFEKRNLSPFGVEDMAGNAWEWTASWYKRFRDCPHESTHYGQIYRVVRGGSWRNSQREARISCRGRYKPDVRRAYLGFRIASD